MKLPEAFLEKMKDLLEDEFECFLKSYGDKKYQGLKVNTLKINVEEFLEICPFKLRPIPWCKEGFYFEENDRPAKHPYYHAGLYYIQEPSAMAPVPILEAKEKQKVLDLCAAPGGKTVQLAGAIGEEGVIVTNDINFNRVKALIKNIELYGIKNAIVVNETPEKLTRYFPLFFDRILVDAPCSGEGMFRKDPSLIKSWGNYNTDYYSNIQEIIMDNMAKMLKPGGRALYSTCTFSPEENEGTIQKFLDHNPPFKLVSFPKLHGFQSGEPKWVNGDEVLRNCARLWPHQVHGEGHFVALLEKTDVAPTNTSPMDRNRGMKVQEDFNNFVLENLNRSFSGIFEVHNGQLYLLPSHLPSLKGLKVIRSGWLLGAYKKSRFEPSHALAMGLTIGDVKRVLQFGSNDKEVFKYLKGETLNISGEKGWTLVCVDEYPLGWAKQTGNFLKSHYPASWRWMD